MTTERAGTTNLCGSLLKRWDPMFAETIDPTRAKRREAILEVLAGHFRGAFRVVELGTGPGPLTAQVLRRFPKCEVVAVDTDPVLLQVGDEALHRFRRRITWTLADIREKRWSSKLPLHRFDAVVSSLALHWLEEGELRTLYRVLGRLLDHGGLLVNGDYIPSGRPASRRHGEGGRKTSRGAQPGANVRAFKLQWKKWWEAIEREPSMNAAIRERQARLPGPMPPRRTTGPKVPVSLEAHEQALRDAGFVETSVAWQDGGFRVLVGRR